MVSTLTGPSYKVSKNNVVNCSVPEYEDILYTIGNVLHDDGIDFSFNLHDDNSVLDDAEKDAEDHFPLISDENDTTSVTDENGKN